MPAYRRSLLGRPTETPSLRTNTVATTPATTTTTLNDEGYASFRCRIKQKRRQHGGLQSCAVCREAWSICKSDSTIISRRSHFPSANERQRTLDSIEEQCDRPTLRTTEQEAAAKRLEPIEPVRSAATARTLPNTVYLLCCSFRSWQQAGAESAAEVFQLL